MTDTIAAVATPYAAGGISIIRISGKKAISVADQVFRAASGHTLHVLGGYRCAFGHVQDISGQPIDQAIATVFRAPKSYTGENVVEISCHGGLYITQQVLRTVLQCGASPAQPGEFTKRAFLNGKMGLTEAEAVMELVSAQGKSAARLALAAHEGALHKRILDIRKDLLHAAAQLSAWVDYPDEDIPELDGENLLVILSRAKADLSRLIDGFDTGQVLREGVNTVIVGRPNVGKSTLMNLLVGSEKSIVTAVAGTTRDVVEDTVRLGDVLLHLADTAGIRTTNDLVEQIGVDRARSRLERAGLVLAVFDSSESLSDDDLLLLDDLRDLHAIAVINKSDLPKKIDESYILPFFKHTVYISAEDGQGLNELSAAVSDLLSLSTFQEDDALLATERQRKAAVQAYEALLAALQDLTDGMTLDAVNVSLDDAIESLLSLTGERVTEAVVDEIFASFCVGK